ncbi:MAG TPA: HlyD family efflux transporter periplasmic adaptor subunit [Gammaproteobacteria bacterium]
MMKLKFRTVFWTAATVVLAVLLALAFRPQAVAVDLAEVSRGPMRVTVRDEGRTRVRNEYVVSAPVGGLLLRVEYKAGAHVHAGQPVARILPGTPPFLDAREQADARAAVAAAEAAVAAARAELEQAEAQAAYARSEAERVTAVHERGLTSAEELDRARMQLRVAEGALRTASEAVRLREAELDRARIRLLQPDKADADAEPVEVLAPVSGRVLRVTQESETVVAPGAELMLLGDPSDLEVVVEMLSTDAVQVKPGAEAIIENWSGGTAEPLRGRVRLVEPYGFLKISALGVEEQRVNVIVDFTGPREEWASLGHGFRVEAAIVTWQADDVVQAPVAALFRNAGRWAVFRVENGRARLTPVEIGQDNGRTAEILSGLEAGQQVVLYPGEELADGVRVTPRSNSG